MNHRFKPGDRVVYRKTKSSTHPTLKAVDVHPAEHGDAYTYQVNKYWTVTRVVDADTLEVKTRTGKVHQVRSDDPLLRRANLLERVFQSGRFPAR